MVAGLLGFVMFVFGTVNDPPSDSFEYAGETVMPGLELEGAFIRSAETDFPVRASEVVLKAVEPGPRGAPSRETPLSVCLENVNPELVNFEVTGNNSYELETYVDRIGSYYSVNFCEPENSLFWAMELENLSELTVAVFGDVQGGWSVAYKIAERMRELEPDFIIFTGDHVINPTPVRLRLVERLFESMGGPVYSCPGNHDLDREKASRLYEEYFGPGRRGFKIAGVNFVLGMAPHAELAEDELPWLESELLKARARGGEILVFGHVPPFNPFQKPDIPAFCPDRGREAMELLSKYGVRMACFGHVHNYFKGIRGGVEYLVSGGAGARMKYDDPFFHYNILRINNGVVSHEMVRLDDAPRGTLHLEHFRNALLVLGLLADEFFPAFLALLAFMLGWLAFWPLMLAPTVMRMLGAGRARVAAGVSAVSVLDVAGLWVLLVALGRMV